MLSKLFSTVVALSFVVAALAVTSVKADETAVNKAKDQVGDTTTSAKKMARAGKRHVRKATGNDNALKDARDKANDAGDDLSNGADKVERKAGVK